MADVLNTSTLEMRASVNEGAAPYNAAPWIVIAREQFNLWSAIPIIYRKWVVDHIEEMTQPEKDAVDAAILNAARDAVAAQLDQQEDVLRAFMLTVLDEVNNLGAKITEVQDAIDAATNAATIISRVQGVSNYPTRTAAQLRAAIRAKLGS